MWNLGSHDPEDPDPSLFPDIFSSLPQPILSPSILDHLINNDRKLPPEYNLPHTYVEMQVRGPAKPGLGVRAYPPLQGL